MMRVIGLAVVGFLAGLILGYVASIGVYILWTLTPGALDRDGGIAMGVAFGFGPLVALVCGIIGSVWLGRRAARRRTG